MSNVLQRYADIGDANDLEEMSRRLSSKLTSLLSFEVRRWFCFIRNVQVPNDFFMHYLFFCKETQVIHTLIWETREK